MAPSKLLVNVTLALVVLATLLLQVALYEKQMVIWPGWVQLALAVAVASSAARLCRPGSGLAVTAMAVLALLPIAWAGVITPLLGYGDPFEVCLAYFLRNLMLGLAATRSSARAQHFAGLSSLFLVMFSFLCSMTVTTTALLVGYSLLGMWWLLGCYWDGIQGRFADRTEQAIPVRPALGAIGVVVLLVVAALPIAGQSRVTRALSGFMPSSGGNRWTDNSAFSGVGDGDQMVAAKDSASSFGPVDSDLFLESKMPSLYDVFNEFGEPRKRDKSAGRRRAIPLAASAMQRNHERLGENQRASREFDTVRNPTSKSQASSRDQLSAALLQVRGRVPVHLGLRAYDTWDGRLLSSSGAGETTYRKLDQNSPDGRAWMRLSIVLPDPPFNYTELHQVRVINLKTKRIPAPPNPTAVNLDYLHDPDFFTDEEDGVLAINASQLPQLTVLTIESQRTPRAAAPDLVRSAAAESHLKGLAEAWTDGVEPGWLQVEAICARLREEYQLDPTATAPEGCDEPVDYFLHDSRRGPDYLFATSAALLARSLGYETRVRSGLYAHPQNYDSLTDLTSVYKEDAHFWLEVRASAGFAFNADSERRSGCWLTVDPCPGYEVLTTPDTWLTRLRRSVADMAKSLVAHPASAGCVFALVAAALWFRVYLLDRLATAWWALAHRSGDARHAVLSTVRLLERRAWLQNTPRPPGATIGRWRLHTGAASPATVEAFADFRLAASWALYGGDAPAVAPADEILTACRAAARTAMRATRRPYPAH
ncbi:MAG: transglutaminase-like domain-containing protein [Planctomycetota bacterium]